MGKARKLGWLDRLLGRFVEHRVIENSCGDPYLVRYFLMGRSDKRSRFFKGAVYLHHILRSDEDRHLHDHPWPFTSLILWGGYREVHPIVTGRSGYTDWGWLSVIRHAASDSHRLILDRPAWTLVFRGEKERSWGFHTENGWTPWAKYTSSPEYLARGGKPPC